MAFKKGALAGITRKNSPEGFDMSKSTALIIGVGAATGAAVCRALADRYRLLMVARSGAVISELAHALPDAHAFMCDVANEIAWQQTLEKIVADYGIPDKILLNTEKAAWGPYNELSRADLRTSFDVNVISLLHLVQTLFPISTEIKAGTRILISSSPAAYAAPASFLGLAPSRVAQRSLAELLNSNLSPHGLRLSIFSINGAIDEPKMRAAYPDQPTAYFIQPEASARAMVAHFDSEDFPIKAEIRGLSSFA